MIRTISLQAMPACMLVWMLSACAGSTEPGAPQAVNGTLDLSDWDFERDGPVELRGQWLFEMGKDLGRSYPEGVASLAERVNVPGSWTRPEFLSEGSLPSFGYASYALKVKLPPHLPHRFGISFGDVFLSGDLQVWGDSTGHSARLAKGQFCKKASECLFENSHEEFVELRSTTAGELLIVLRVSNWHHGTTAGVYRAPTLSEFTSMSQSFMWKHWLSAVLIGVLMIVSVYFLCLFISRPDDVGLLYFCLLCFGTGVREILLSGTFARLGLETSSFGYSLQIALEYAAMPLLAYVALAYVAAFFNATPQLTPYIRVVKIVSLGLALFAFIAPTEYVTRALVLFQLELVAVLFISLPLSIYFAFSGRPFGIAFLLSAVIISLGTVNDLLHAAQIISTGYYVPHSLMVFVLMQSVTLASKFTRAMNERDAKSRELLSTYQKLDAELLKRESLEASNVQLAKENQAAGQQLIQADKLATMGTLVAGVAHDIANPTGLILGSTTLMDESRATLRQSLHELLKDSNSDEAMSLKAGFTTLLDQLDTESANIRLGAARIQTINSAIRNQARRDQAPSIENLKTLIEECCTIVGHRLFDIQVEVHCPQKLDVEIIRSQFGQVLINLLVNASDAITEQAFEGQGRIAIRVHELEQSRFSLTVDDSGPGIPIEMRAKILEPFFTTKAVGKGTGLGMPIVLRILEVHGMTLTIEDAPELGGARFAIEPIFS